MSVAYSVVGKIRPWGVLSMDIAVIPDAAIVVDDAGNILDANSQAVLLFGYSVDALRRMNVDSLVPEAIRHRHREHRRQYTAAPRQRPMALGRTLSAQRSDGTLINVEIALGPFSKGETLAIIRDVSARQEPVATVELLVKTILTSISRLRYEVRLLAIGLALLVIAFIIHVVITILR